MIGRIHETIMALSSPPGHGAVGIVRLSGPEALSITSKLVDHETAIALRACPGDHRTEGEVYITDELTLPAAFLVFKSPKSYTRQDMVEIHTVGSPPALEMIREQAVAMGAIAASPGEFTARAFLNGRLDLARAEAVAATIHAESDSQLRAARRMMEGTLSKRVKQSRDELAEILALVEADIDFAEEPIDFIRPDALRARVDSLRVSLDALVQAGPTVERLGQLPHVLLVGPPNAGKSTLINALSGIDRAICSAVSGTTRDVLSAPINLGRGEAILLDAAGIDESIDPVIREGRAKALLAAEQVDVVCIVIDISTSSAETVRELTRGLELPTVIVAANKCDLLDVSGVEARSRELSAIGRVVSVSAKTAQGVEQLRAAIGNALGSRTQTVASDVALLTERQRDAIVDASEALRRVAELAGGANETIDCADLLAFELREALDALGLVTGEVTTEDLLSHVFANFCLGK
jgi:tRNA modification GTPase